MKFTFSFLLFLSSLGVFAQGYLICFTASGAANTYDSIEVINLTQCTDKWLYSQDTLLLGGQIGILENYKPSENLLVYPNPFTESCSIDFLNPQSEEVSILIFDISGRKIINQRTPLLAGKHTCKLDGLGKGVFIVQIQSANFSSASRIISINENSNKKVKMDILSQIQEEKKPEDKTQLKSIVQMDYNAGDMIYFKAFSGNHIRIITMIVSQNMTVNFEFKSCTDIDNNNYPVVKIGNQYWMAENLKVTKYQNGDSIPTNLNNNTWTSTTQGAYGVYPYADVDGINSYSEMLAEYGALYNWYSVADNRGVCPSGWHVPTDAEWNILSDFLGGLTETGGKLKILCSKHWDDPNTGATNETGFTALPGGYKWQQDGLYYEAHQACYFWTSSTDNSPTTDSWRRRLKYNESNLNRSYAFLRNGFSVRCIKD